MLISHVPTASTTSTPRSLIGIGLTNRRDLQRVHTNLGVVDLELGVARVDNVQNTIDCSTSVNVCTKL